MSTHDSAERPPGSSRPSGSRSSFDTFETNFFREGEARASMPVEVESFDDLDEGFERKRFAPSRKLVAGVAIGSTCVAIVACVISWSAFGRSVSSVSPAASPALPVATRVEAAAFADPPAQPAAREQAAPVMPPPAEPTVAAARPTGAVLETSPADPTPAKAERAAGPAEKRDRCRKAISRRRNKEILAACAQAFAADSSAAEAAVAIARIEFDRGRSAQALAWGKKAIAADPNTADAYVFVGGAEQSIGHDKAAKEAYMRYLELAPHGRYASDLRVIVGSL